MAKRRKKKTSQGQPSSHHLQCHVVEVDNPGHNPAHPEALGNPRTVRATVNMAESVAAHWHHKRLIDDAQMAAASRFRQIWERANSVRGLGLDYEAIKVDTFGPSDPIPTGQLDAAKELVAAGDFLAPEGYNLLCRLCGQCIRLADHSNSRAERDRAAAACREHLARLAVFFGYSSAPMERKRA